VRIDSKVIEDIEAGGTKDETRRLTIDPMCIPQVVELTPLTTPEGALAAYGPGEKPVLSLKDWRAMFRVQQVAFKLAREICIRWQGDNGAAAVPVQVLFPKVAFAAKRFLAEKLERKGDSEPCDVLLVGEYMQAAIGPAGSHKEGRFIGKRRSRGHPARRSRARQHALCGLPHHQADLFGDQLPPQCYGCRYPEMGTKRRIPAR
jgi:hypothetical protein